MGSVASMKTTMNKAEICDFNITAVCKEKINTTVLTPLSWENKGNCFDNKRWRQFWLNKFEVLYYDRIWNC